MTSTIQGPPQLASTVVNCVNCRAPRGNWRQLVNWSNWRANLQLFSLPQVPKTAAKKGINDHSSPSWPQLAKVVIYCDLHKLLFPRYLRQNASFFLRSGPLMFGPYQPTGWNRQRLRRVLPAWPWGRGWVIRRMRAGLGSGDNAYARVRRFNGGGGTIICL